MTAQKLKLHQNNAARRERDKGPGTDLQRQAAVFVCVCVFVCLCVRRFASTTCPRGHYSGTGILQDYPKKMQHIWLL